MAYEKQGFADGNVLTAGQLINIEEGIIASQVDHAVCGMPVLYLMGETSGMSKDNAVPLDYIYGGMSGTCTLKWQGSSSLAYPKKNYTIKFDSAFEAVEGWGKQKKYCLKANYIDHSHARNVVSAKLWGQVVKSRAVTDETRDALLNSLPNGGAIDGFLVIVMLNGEFHGLYTFNIPKDGWMFGLGDEDALGAKQAIVCADNHTSQTQFQNAAVSLDGANFELEYATNADDGEIELIILKTGYNIDASGNETALEGYAITDNVPVNHDSTYTLNVLPGCVDNYMRVVEYAEDGTFIKRQLLDNALGAAAFALELDEGTSYFRLCTNENDLQYYTLTGDSWVVKSLSSAIGGCIASDGTDLDALAELIDWESAIDYYIFTALIGGHDNIDKNYLLMTIGDGRKWTFSAYDMDSTFGLYWDGSKFISPNTCTPTIAEFTYHRVMYLINTYKAAELKARYAELRASILSEANVATEFCNFIGSIQKPILNEDVRVWSGVPSSSANTVDQILNWYRLRVAVIDAEIAAL